MKFYKKDDKKLLNAWAFYDWANSVYPLVISTAIFPIYWTIITKSENINFLWFESIQNDAFISYLSSITFIILAFISPLLSGIADYTGQKKLFMQLFCYMGVISCLFLYYFGANHFNAGIFYYFFAIVGFWGSLVFYNSYLPDIANKKQQDLTSAKGYSLGYIGSTLLLIAILFFVNFPQIFNINHNIYFAELGAIEATSKIPIFGSFRLEYFLEPSYIMAMKLSFIFVGVWWFIFSQYSFYYLPGKTYYSQNKYKLFSYKILLSGFNQIKVVFNKLKENRRLKLFLLSFFIFTIPSQTIILLATYFGSDLNEIDWLDEEAMKTGLIIAIIVIQILAALGAYLSAKLSSIFGNFKTLILVNVIWAIICLFGFFVKSPLEFYLAAAFIGLAMGGIQTLSRSTYSKLIDSEDSTSYFGFYDFSQKLSIVLGTALYGTMDLLLGNVRIAILLFALFFIPSILLLIKLSYSKK